MATKFKEYFDMMFAQNKRTFEDFKKVELKNQNVETLLYDFLSELVYFKDAELLLFSRIKVEVTKNKIYNLKAVLHGEKLNKKHSQKVDVKAVTFHKFEIKKRAKDYIARVILDI